MTDKLSSADQLTLRTSVREALTAASTPQQVRAEMATERGWDRQVWQRLCGELGIAGITVEESRGGSGLSYVEAAVVFEEAGRVLLCAPLLAVVGLALPMLEAIGDESADTRLLPGLIDGTLTAAVVTADGDGRSAPANLGVTAESDRLSGRAGFVVDGASADVVLVPARTSDGVGIYCVDRAAANMRTTPLVTLDQTRKQAHLDFDETPAVRIGTGDATRSLNQALDVARALLANEQVGVASQSLDVTVAFAKQRVQFGRPIGSFQAVKQKLADLLIKVESAKSAATAAARSVASGDEDSGLVVAVAKAYCSEAASTATAEAIQLHGGIGFTWEHDAHLYFKRARASQEMLGTPREHYETIAELIAQ
jgi:alkylation response protein AidB-like acyl-CoA dehydrogenase